MKLSEQKMYMEIARVVGNTSYAVRKKVGAVAVKNGRLLCEGRNGTPPNTPNVCEDMINGELVTNENTIHAEINLINKMKRDGEYRSLNGSVLFVTLSPCVDCGMMIMNSGIIKVIYEEEYRDTSGIEYLKSHGIEVVKFGD